MKYKIIGLIGEKGSGKDTVCNLLTTIDSSFTRIAFADELKNDVCKVLGITRDKLEAVKNEPFVRHMLQWYGVDYCRFLYGDNYWLQRADKYLITNKMNYPLIVTDVRFHNEAVWVKQHEGYLVKIQRKIDKPIDITSEHASETELAGIQADWLIMNTSMYELVLEVANLYKFLSTAAPSVS